MRLPVVIRPAAGAEFAKAALWYEGQRTGLGVDFVAAVQQVFDLIADQPDRYPIVFGTIREAPISQFPYCIYYRVKPDRLVVIAIFHQSRDPAIWKKRR
jgi:toxin ParE1/3/4